MIRYQAVSKVFMSRSRGELTALRDIDLTINPGSFTCIVGPSGCGKTTLLRLAAGLERADSGSVQVNGATINGARLPVGLVSQEGDLLPWRTVIDNISLGWELQGMGRRERHERGREALAAVHLPADSAKAFPHELSGGMRQRVALARAWALHEPVLLLDEPFAKLDEITRHALQDELLRLWKERGQTVLFVTHSIEEAVYLGERVIVMNFAQLVNEITVELERPRDRYGEAFVGHLLEVRNALRA